MTFSNKKYLQTKRGHVGKYLSKAKGRAKEKNLPENLTLEYLESIATDHCPVFGNEFVWGRYKNKRNHETPSLDRVIPELGYVVGNVVFISDKANRIKAEFTENELYKVADWLHDKRKEVLNVFKEQLTPVPVEHTGESKEDSTYRPIYGTRTGQDCDGSHHHRGEPEGQDPCDSTKESCRICMGSGVRQMEALNLYVNCKDYGLTEGEVESIAKLFGCICHQS